MKLFIIGDLRTSKTRQRDSYMHIQAFLSSLHEADLTSLSARLLLSKGFLQTEKFQLIEKSTTIIYNVTTIFLNPK
jgi:hypothetical protein